MYYKTCECCGAALDPGEQCDCKEANMTHQMDEIEDQVVEIIKNNPRLSASGISINLRKLYGRKLSVDTVRKITNRMIQFGGLRADKSTTGAIVYYFVEEA